MTLDRFRFEDFTFDPGERLLLRGTQRLELNGRYLDALALMLRERGRLVTKERFMDEVWNGVPVTDEALTQCIRTLRRQLGDDAASPRFIETVPKHGYRFTAEVELAPTEAIAPPPTSPRFDVQLVFRTGGLAGLGGATAGVGGGLLYGLTASPSTAGLGIGAISVLLVLLALSVLIGFTAGLGVGGGIAAAGQIPNDKWQWLTGGGMLGGFVIGAVTKLLGLDGFDLLFGRSPSEMTGPAEGALLGAALGFAVWIALKRRLSLAPALQLAGSRAARRGCWCPCLAGICLAVV
jgi:DNA-binding winged helix-turn-helix (wHTH) protein